MRVGIRGFVSMSSSKILPRIVATLQRTKIITHKISINNYLLAINNNFHYNTKLVIDNEKWQITGHDSHYWIISPGEIRAVVRQLAGSLVSEQRQSTWLNIPALNYDS